MLFKMEHVAKKICYKHHNINYVAKVKKNKKVNFSRSASLTVKNTQFEVYQPSFWRAEQEQIKLTEAYRGSLISII